MTETANGDQLDMNGRTRNSRKKSKVKFRDEHHENHRDHHDNDPKNSSSKEVSKSGSVHSLTSYLIALRPWSFPATLTPVALGAVLYTKSSGSFPCVWTLIASCLCSLSVHAAGNLVNTYMDFKKGVDSKKSDDRILVDHILELNDIANMGVVCYCLGCVGFTLTVYLSSSSVELLAFIFFGGLSGSFFYTGGLGLKYIALGDLLILLTFGPITVLFTFISQGGELSLMPLFYAIPLALNTEAILHSNNTRDMAIDKKSGICTLAIILGKTGSYIFFVFLLFTPFCIFTYLAVKFSKMFILPLSTIIIAFRYERIFRNGDLAKMPQRIAKLNLVMGFAYVLAVALTPVTFLPRFGGF